MSKSLSADLNISLDLLDLDLYEGIGISSKYKYQVERSERPNMHTRIDRYQFKLNVRPGSIIREALDLPINVGINRGSEVCFVRHFTEKKAALQAIPYTPRNLPLNAERALEHLIPGDYVALPVNLTVSQGTGLSSEYAGTVGLHAGISANVFVTGGFFVQVYRMHDSKVRLRLSTQASSVEIISGSLSR